MPLDPRRAPQANRAAPASARSLAAAVLWLALGCASAGPPGSGPHLCSLFGTCAPPVETAWAPPPLIDFEPEPVAVPPIEGGRLLLRCVSFASGSAEIDPESAIVLDVAAGEILERTAVRIRVEGYTDGVGGVDSNEALAQRRAEAVRRYLVRKGVAPQRLETSAHGAASPVAPNETEAGRARNRRVELVVLWAAR